MKLVTQEELQEFDGIVRDGGVKGLALGLGTSIPFSLYLQRYSPRYQRLPVPLKAFGVVMLTSATTVIWAERAGLQYDKRRYSSSLYSDEEKAKLAQTEKAKAQRLSIGEKATNFVNDNKYSVIVGSWAASMVGAWAYISRDKLQTVSQRIVQVRVFAQGVTLAMIVGTAFLSQKERQERKEHPPVDHSWMNQMNQKPEDSTVQKVTTA